MEMKPFWWDIKENLETSVPLILPSSADIVIVGGGFTGLSAALLAAQHGREVVVLDAQMPGFGASTRNGGICSGHIRISHADLSRQYGKEYADGVYAEGVEARHDLKSFCTEAEIECQLTQTGHFSGALSIHDYDKLGRQCDALRGIEGHDVELIPRHRVHEEIATMRFHGGLLRREIGGFHPGRFYSGLLAQVTKAGVDVFAKTSVEMIEDDGSGENKVKVITTPRGKIRAKKVLIATNGYTGRRRSFGHYLRQRLVPVQSSIITTEVLGRRMVKTVMPGLRMYGNTAKLSSYFRPTPDGDRIMLGSRSFDRLTPSSRSITFLQKKLTYMLPQLMGVKIDYCWLGNVAFNRQQLPSLFEHEDIYYAAGYAGSGTVWARWLGKKAAEKILGLDTKPSIFDASPPKPIPFYDGNPWFMPFVNRWFELQDNLNERQK